MIRISKINSIKKQNNCSTFYALCKKWSNKEAVIYFAYALEMI